MATGNGSTIQRVRDLNTSEAIRADPVLGPHERNVVPLTGRLGTVRRTTKTLGTGTYGRVNLESLEEGNVATKYYLQVKESILANTSEIACLKYLQDVPNVAQLIRLNTTPPAPQVGPALAPGKETLNFPAAVLGKAIGSLNDQSLYKSWDDVFSAVKQILIGYYNLHSLGITHRDTKPENMLMTATREVWISDFGFAKYNDEHIPISDDNVMGTPVYAAPELILRSILKKKGGKKNFFASDAWAVGASIYHIMTGKRLVFGPTLPHLLSRTFEVKGTPVIEDGEVFTLYQEYLATPNPRIHNYPEEPSAIARRLFERTIHKPTNNSTLLNVCLVVERLMQYKPDARDTIQEALQNPVFSGGIPASLSRPSLTDQYIKKIKLPQGITATRLEVLFDYLYNILTVDNVYSGDYMFSQESQPFILDRTGVYILSFLDTNKSNPYVNENNLDLIGAVGLFLAAAFFDTNKRKKFNIRQIRENTQNKYSEAEVLKCITMYMTSPIQFYGRTAFDYIINSTPSLDEELLETYAYLNYVCYQQSIFLTLGNADVAMGKIAEFISSGELPVGMYIRGSEPLGVGNASNELIQKFRRFLGLADFIGGSRIAKTRRYRKRRNRKTRNKQ